MKLIKWNFWILKKQNNFSYLWKFEPDIPNSFGETLFEKPPNLQRLYELINVLPPSNFVVFNCCYFLCYWLQRAETCTKLHKLTSPFNFESNWYTRLQLLWVMSKNVNNDVIMNPPISFTFFIVLGQCKIPKRFLESFVFQVIFYAGPHFTACSYFLATRFPLPQTL